MYEHNKWFAGPPNLLQEDRVFLRDREERDIFHETPCNRLGANGDGDSPWNCHHGNHVARDAAVMNERLTAVPCLL